MKKTILLSTLFLLIGMGFTVSANALTCADLTWSAERLAKNSNIADVCLEVVERNGGNYAKLRAKIVRQGVNSTVVQYQRPDGSWSASERVFPAGFEALIAGENVKIADLAPRQELNVYIRGEGNFSVPAPAAEPVAVAVAPPPPPEPEPEPEPVALPTTATQLPLLALLGGLLVLMGGLVSVVRTRL
ncbi:MAG: hypothetical protein V3R56_06145 [Xanthomonadales bacterium]